jgi:hypothetical protein
LSDGEWKIFLFVVCLVQAFEVRGHPVVEGEEQSLAIPLLVTTGVVDEETLFLRCHTLVAQENLLEGGLDLGLARRRHHTLMRRKHELTKEFAHGLVVVDEAGKRSR